MKYKVGDRIRFIDDGRYIDEVAGKYGYVKEIHDSYMGHTILEDNGTPIMISGSNDYLWTSNLTEEGITLCEIIDIRKKMKKHSMI